MSNSRYRNIIPIGLIVLFLASCTKPANLLKEDLETWEKKAVATELLDSAYQLTYREADYTSAIALIDSANLIHEDSRHYRTKGRYQSRIGKYANAIA